jgi:hypothetical protein
MHRCAARDRGGSVPHVVYIQFMDFHVGADFEAAILHSVMPGSSAEDIEDKADTYG